MSLLLPSIAMMLGWGLRGFIGGGPLGAMIPGAMVALAICLTRGITPAALACAFGAIAISFGGEMTYGQTVGAAIAPETRAWGLLGLTVKGAVWGLLGGAILALAFQVPKPKKMALLALLLAVSTAVGWKLISQPKLIYFSNLLDRPREEVWAGLLLAGLTLIQIQPGLLRFALYGTLGGGLGFGLGGALQAYGIQFFGRDYPWWKGMEFTFGLLLGLALAHAAQNINAHQNPHPPPAPLWQQLIAASLFSLLLIVRPLKLPVRFEFLILGLIALCALTLFPWAAWQLALTVTAGATFFDLGKHQHDLPAAAATILLAVAVARYVHSAATAFLLLTWTTVAVASVKFILQGSGPENIVGIAFITMAVALTLMVRRVPLPNAP